MANSERLEVRVSPEWLARVDQVRGLVPRGAYVKRCVELQVAKALADAPAKVPSFDPRVTR